MTSTSISNIFRSHQFTRHFNNKQCFCGTDEMISRDQNLLKTPIFFMIPIFAATSGTRCCYIILRYNQWRQSLHNEFCCFSHVLMCTFAWICALYSPSKCMHFITLRPRHTNGRHFADDIFKCIFLNENNLIPIKISLKFVSKGQINNIPAVVQIMAWRRPGNKPLSDPMVVSLPTHICFARPQWIIFQWF